MLARATWPFGFVWILRKRTTEPNVSAPITGSTLTPTRRRITGDTYTTTAPTLETTHGLRSLENMTRTIRTPLMLNLNPLARIRSVWPSGAASQTARPGCLNQPTLSIIPTCKFTSRITPQVRRHSNPQRTHTHTHTDSSVGVRIRRRAIRVQVRWPRRHWFFIGTNNVARAHVAVLPHAPNGLAVSGDHVQTVAAPESRAI